MESKITKGGSITPRGGFFDLPGDRVQRYVWVSEFARTKRVLDAGCGRGYGSRYLLDEGASYVLGLDSDPDAIQFARKSYGRPDCEFELCDVTKLETTPTSFDVVVSFEVIEHLVDVSGYLEGISRVLKRGGLYVLSTPNKHNTIFFYRDGKSPNYFHVREYYPEELLELLRVNFSVEGLYVQFDKTIPDAQLEVLRRTAAYTIDCPIPSSLRKIVPDAVKDLWLHHKHLSNMESGQPRGKWKNYVIERLDDPREIDARYPTVLLTCRRA